MIPDAVNCSASKAMPTLRFPVSIVIERVPIANRWVSEQWRIGAVEPESIESAPACRRLEDLGGVARWCCDGFAIELTRSESEGYFLNITAPEPKTFVLCRSDEPEPGSDPELKLRAHVVTVSYNEAARFLDGGERVDAVALHPAILEWMRPFVTENYRPEPRRKSRRNELYERDGNVTPAPKRDQ